MVGDSDGPTEGGHRAGVGPLVSAPEVLHPQAVSAPQTVSGVGADHHGPSSDHLLPVLPDHHQLAQVLHCARQRHLVQCCHELSTLTEYRIPNMFGTNAKYIWYEYQIHSVFENITNTN